ncbi:MAG: hypothetical protein IKY02_05105, partial [Lachnospiraceae bacterium]|nr:hypothetical protein [Lachnospiraceae bacterium]
MRLTVDMERVSSYGEKTVSNWSGIYQGSIRIEIWHDLSQFDTNFPMLFTNASNVFNKMQGNNKTLPDSAKESSKLTKVVTLSDAEIQIDKRNAVGTTVTKNVPLAGAEDVSNFKLSHVVSYALVLGPWEDGKLDIFGSGASYHSEVGMNEQCSGTVLEGNRYPAIVWENHEVVAWDELLAPSGAGWSKRALAGNGSTNISRPAIVDYQIFNDLRDNQIT